MGRFCSGKHANSGRLSGWLIRLASVAGERGSVSEGKLSPTNKEAHERPSFPNFKLAYKCQLFRGHNSGMAGRPWSYSGFVLPLEHGSKGAIK